MGYQVEHSLGRSNDAPTKTPGALLLVSLVMLGVTISLTQPAQAETVNREWSGNHNNNWGNSQNWKNGGAANDPNENAIFDYTGSNRSIDLEGRSFDVFNIVFNLVNPNDGTSLKSYDFGSNSNGAGKILIHGDMTVNAITGETVMFRTDAHLEQSAAGTWTNNGGEVIVNTKLSGTAGLTLAGDFTFSSPDNIYSGQLTLQSGTTTIAEANAFQYATVQMGGTNVLNITSSDGSANFAALQGTGNFDLGGYSLTFGSNDASTSYTGVISGGGTLNKTGTGTWTIGAANMFSGTLNVQSGTVKLVQNGSGTGQSTALADSTVNIDVNNGLNVDGNGATLGALTGKGNLNLGATTLTVGANNASTTYTGVISGSSGSLVKTGTGDFTLSGASTYTGNTTIEGGSLTISAANNLGNGSELRLDQGTLITNGSFTLNRNIEQSNLNGPSSTIQVNDSGNTVAVSRGISGIANLVLHKAGDGGLRLNQSGTYAGEVEIDAGAIIIGDTNALKNATMHVNVNDGIDMVDGGVDATFAGLTGSGNINNGGHTITINGNFNETYSGILSGAGGLTKLGQGDLTLSAANSFTGDTKIGSDNLIDGKVILGNANALKNSTVYINTDNRLDINGFNANLGGLTGSGALNIGSQTVTIGSNNADTTYAGVLSGSTTGLLIKSGNGDLTFTGGDSSTPSEIGRLRIKSGRLILDNAGLQFSGAGSYLSHDPAASLIVTGSDASFSGGRFDVGESSGDIGHIVFEKNSAGSLSDLALGFFGTGQLTVQSGAHLDTDKVYFGYQPASLGTGLVTGGSSSLTANALIFATYSSSSNMLTVEDGGDVQVAGNTSFRKDASQLIVNGGTFSTDLLSNSTGITPTISISDPTGGGPALKIGANNGSSTWDGIIQDAASGAGSVLKTGTGTLTLAGANTFTGTANIDGGQVILANADALKNSTVSINVDNGLDVTTNQINANLGALSGSGNLNLGTTSVKAGGNGATTTYSGTISGDVGGNAKLRKVGAGTLTVTGTVNNLYELWASNNGQLILSGADVGLLQISSLDYHSPGATDGAEVVISDGSTVVSTGDVAHSDADYNGTLRMTDPGTSLTTWNLGATTGRGSVIIQNEALATVKSSFYAGAFAGTSSGIGSVTVESGGRVEGSAAGLFGQDPGDEGTLTITGAGSTVELNELRLGGKATSPGGTGTAIVKDGGALTVNGAIKLWTTTSSLTVDGGTCSVDTLFNDTGATSTINLSDANSATQALTVGVSGGNSAFDGLIQDATGGPGSILKTGTGAFTLSGANTFTGGVTVAGGALLTSNTTGSATGAGAVTVNTGGTLGGTGSAAGLTTVASGGTVAPGASAGVLTLGSVVFNAGSKLGIQIGGTSPGSGHDRLVVNNSATLGGTLDLSYIDPFTTTPGQLFVILTAGTLTGTFDTVNYPDGQDWSIAYDTDAGTVTVGICADSDADGVCDADDLCPGTPSGAMVDADGCAIPAPTILGWASVRTHGNNVGDLAIDLNANGSRLPTTEPRRDGIRKIVVTFSEAVEAVDGTLDTNDVVVFGFDNGAQVPTSLTLDGGTTGTVLTIHFANGLPDDEIYAFTLAGKFKSAATSLLLDGDTDAEVANYEGDARDTAPSTESIDILDLQAIKIAILGGAAPTARTDLNPDGQLNIIDMVFVKKNLGNAFPAP